MINNLKPNIHKLNLRRMLGLAGLVLALGAILAVPPSVQADTSAPLVAERYIAKLKNTGPAVLQPYAFNIERQFVFSQNSDFQNIYSFGSEFSLPDLRQKLSGSYAYLELDADITAGQTEVIPNDPGFTRDDTDTSDQWGLAKAGFPEAWSITTGSTTNVVAVIDTGIDAAHKDLARTVFRDGYDFIADVAITDRINSDNNGHGTLVAGIIGAVTNNGIGIAGSNWKISLMPLKALNEKGSGTSSNVSEAIVWAADHGADIINLSLGGNGFSHDTTLSNSITYAYRRNIVIVAAAGNDAATTGGNLDTEPVFPICHDNGENMIIGVTATDQNDLKPGFANYGKICIDVSAPGRRILSTINHDPLTGALAPDSYAYASGTSLAVPFVSGQAALLLAQNPDATNREIRDAILNTADKIDELNLSQCAGGSCRGLIGAGRINVAKSLTPSDVSDVKINEGDLVRVDSSETYYYISGGKRHPISAFVKEQRFPGTTVKVVVESDLANYPLGDYAMPRDGTLAKVENDPVIYYISEGLRLPITYQVFLLRNFKFTDVKVLSYNEVNSWLVGSFLSPPEGTLVRTGKNPTVYWVVGGVLHPVNYEFYISRGLQVFPVVYVADEDIKSFSKGDPYIR